MTAKVIYIEVLILVILSSIPWPGPHIFKISCPRDSASIVRKVVQKKWIPTLDKYQVKLPLECPFHPQRDIFYPQQAAKRQFRTSQWTCGFCGKSFFEEKYLDLHFDNRHRNHINMAEDAICLADYCDMFRCEVIATQEDVMDTSTKMNTDLEIWREATSYHTALSLVGPRDLAKLTTLRSNIFTTRQTQSAHASSHNLCHRSEAPVTFGKPENATDSCGNNLVDSSRPQKQTASELQKLKANCKPEQLLKLRTRCEMLVRDCIAGLFVSLSVQDFKDIEEELNLGVCWYLTCDRYWEDSQSLSRKFPWGLITVCIMVLSLALCLCYYVIWVVFDSDDMSIASTSVTASSTPSSHPHYTEEYYTLSDDGQGDYIYVTYPPDLKRKLLESLESSQQL
ncbi:unnamed protein product [Bemisia tabaci]|uniref:C2H2-type domain-containing protein n=1 Tax=Bemisia tabaci TaxID=7038 RepID=A0A9P0C5B6_BEMTA|nr:PREDICTED: uncharacterized protein LOC109033615 isoform X2 [Bemisia tabaci]CAH0771146.1 unnamed protein product [Bemisia tabaci]